MNASKPLKRRLSRFIRGTLAQVVKHIVTKRDHEEITEATKLRDKRQKVDQRVVQKGGAISEKDA